MILTPHQQKKWLYWLLTVLITLLAAISIGISIEFGIITSKKDWFILLFVLVIITFSAHQFLIKILSKASINNTIKQHNLIFASTLIYAHITDSEYELTKSGIESSTYNVKVTMSNEQTRKRILFCLSTIINTKLVILSTDIKEMMQTEWDQYIDPRISLEKRIKIWEKEMKEMKCLSKEYSADISEIAKETYTGTSTEKILIKLSSIQKKPFIIHS